MNKERAERIYDRMEKVIKEEGGFVLEETKAAVLELKKIFEPMDLKPDEKAMNEVLELIYEKAKRDEVEKVTALAGAVRDLAIARAVLPKNVT